MSRLWRSHSRLLRWETQQFLFVLALLIHMFLISCIQIDSICKALLAILVAKISSSSDPAQALSSRVASWHFSF